MSNKKTTQTNLPTPEKLTEAIPQQPYTTPNYGSQTHMGGSSSKQHTQQPMSPISSFSTVEESVDEREIADEYLTDGYLTEKEQQQLFLDEEALRETLEEQARAEKECEERMSVYLVEQCARKVAPIRSPTGIGAGLGEHLAPMERPDKILIGDRGGFGAWFANRVWGWRVVAPPQTRPIAIPTIQPN
ncbi:hypothetical protein Tco_1319319 [Tanacetum coccineum]